MIFTSLTHIKNFAKAFMAWVIVFVMLLNPLQMVIAVDIKPSQQHTMDDTSMMMDHMNGEHLSQSSHDNACCDAPSCVHLNSVSSLHRKMMYIDTDYASSKISYSVEKDGFLISYYPEQPKRPPKV